MGSAAKLSGSTFAKRQRRKVGTIGIQSQIFSNDKSIHFTEFKLTFMQASQHLLVLFQSTRQGCACETIFLTNQCSMLDWIEAT